MCVCVCVCLCVCLCVCVYYGNDNSTYIFPAEKEGKEVEAAMNAMGPGEATFVKCDMSKEDEIKVSTKHWFLLYPTLLTVHNDVTVTMLAN